MNRPRHCKKCPARNSLLAVITPFYYWKNGKVDTDKKYQIHSDRNVFYICKECTWQTGFNRDVLQDVGIIGIKIVQSEDYEKIEEVLGSRNPLCIYEPYYHTDQQQIVKKLYLEKGRKPLGYYCSLCRSIYCIPLKEIKWEKGILQYRVKPRIMEGYGQWPEFDSLGGYITFLNTEERTDEKLITLVLKVPRSKEKGPFMRLVRKLEKYEVRAS